MPSVSQFKLNFNKVSLWFFTVLNLRPELWENGAQGLKHLIGLGWCHRFNYNFLVAKVCLWGLFDSEVFGSLRFQGVKKGSSLCRYIEDKWVYNFRVLLLLLNDWRLNCFLRMLGRGLGCNKFHARLLVKHFLRIHCGRYTVLDSQVILLGNA